MRECGEYAVWCVGACVVCLLFVCVRECVECSSFQNELIVQQKKGGGGGGAKRKAGECQAFF